ncbi:MAG: TIGR00288 family NYN domain-containing protein [Candidatus Diapherotrites archaeon]|nr:TIGR00288 family NYN domain-containing protein [Candidatus Diapherotrites archaeon]
MAKLFQELQDRLNSVISKKQKRNIAVFVDGPNILRKEFGINLEDVTKALKPFGEIKIGRVFLNQFASQKLIEAIVNQGFETIVTTGDTDVSMAVDITETAFSPIIDAIAVVTRDSDFLPAIIKAKREGKEIIVVLVDEQAAVALKNSADKLIVLPKR